MIEFDLEIRGFTNGYDFYAPNINILYSLIDYKERKNGKENYRKLYRLIWKEKNEKAIRSTHRLRMKTNLDKYIEQDNECKDNVDDTDLSLYALGDIRSLNDYLKFAGIDLISHKLSTDKCIEIRQYKLKRVGVYNKWTIHDMMLLQNYLNNE